MGTSRTITWSHNLGASAFVRLELSRDGGASWEIIASSAQNTAAATGFFQWAVTGPQTPNARIRVTGNTKGSYAPFGWGSKSRDYFCPRFERSCGHRPQDRCG